MMALSIIWLILSLFLFFRFIYKVQRNYSNWAKFSYELQTPAIGLMIFPKYLYANPQVQQTCFWIGCAICLLSLVHIMKQSGMILGKEVKDK